MRTRPPSAAQRAASPAVRVAGRSGAGAAAPPSPGRRQAVVLVTILLVLGVLSGRLVYVQALAGPELAAKAYEKRLWTETVPGGRGEILDANGAVLATSVERYNIVVDQERIAEALAPAQVSAAAEVLAELLDLSAPEVGATLIGTDEPRKFVYLAKGLAPDVHREVMDQQIPGVTGERTTDRMYPAATTGGNVLGFVSAEGSGQAGIELVHDAVLSGTPGSETYERGARGQRIPTSEHGAEAAEPGSDVVLTLDRDLQYVAQQALDAKVKESGAQWGAVELVDVRTGEILALADSGTVDPNDPGDTAPEARGSRAVEVLYEPGSTAKVITMAALLETGTAEPTDRFVVPDRYTASNGQTFKDSHDHAKLQLTLAGILAQSSNTGTVMAGQELPVQVRHDYLRKFGFGERTGVGLPGESPGLLRDAEDWDGRSAYTVLFGQAVSVTTLQATQVFATLANGGVRVQPHLVKGTRSPDGVFTPVELDEPERAVSEETADTVVRMLEGVVVEGTGGKGAVPGYRVAGKTGTSQAFEGNDVIKNVASFIGIAPADDPRIAASVVLYDPKTSIYGGDVAAPVFSEVTAHALQHLGVPPNGSEPDLYPVTYE